MASELKESKEKVCKNKEIEICLVEEFYREYNRLPKQREIYKGVALGTFLGNIKRGSVKITEDQKNRLFKLGIDINAKNRIEVKEYKISLLEEFYKENGRLPITTEQYKGEKVGIFLFNIKNMYIRITEEQLLRLQKLDTKLTREQVSLVKPKVYVKK